MLSPVFHDLAVAPLVNLVFKDVAQQLRHLEQQDAYGLHHVAGILHAAVTARNPPEHSKWVQVRTGPQDEG